MIIPLVDHHIVINAAMNGRNPMEAFWHKSSQEKIVHGGIALIQMLEPAIIETNLRHGKANARSLVHDVNQGLDTSGMNDDIRIEDKMIRGLEQMGKRE